jgi:hypothetical protein
MAITLTYNGTTANLGDRLVWTDEFAWSPVEQVTEDGTTGALLVHLGVRQAGRPITLDGADTCWFSRALCATLGAWAALPGIPLTLVLRGVSREVIFDHERGGFEASPLDLLADGEEYPEQDFRPTLRFLTTDSV